MTQDLRPKTQDLKDMTGLADCNNFFVSCERTLDPTLEGLAVVVLSNNDGCAIARSNEAKRLGVRMGQPAFELRDMIMRGELVALSGNHLLYRDISLRIHDIFRRFVPVTLDYSVDEAFLLMDGIPRTALPEIGAAICDACWDEEHIPVTIGFAPTKTLAKVATEIGKKGGRRVVLLDDPVETERVLASLPVYEMWGIGRRIAKRLYFNGVYTIGDFAAMDRIRVRGEFGVTGERSWRELHGEPCIELEHLERKRQDSISESRTFPVDIDDYDYLRSRMVIYSGHVARRLRAMGGECGALSVFLCTNRFHTERGYHAPTASTRFSPRVSDSAVIASAAVALMESIFDPAYRYKRAGVVISDITQAGVLAPTLFEDVEQRRQATLRSRKLMEAIDRLNAAPGGGVVKLATELTKGHIGHNDGYSSSFGPVKK